jgi:hypothetical protein
MLGLALSILINLQLAWGLLVSAQNFTSLNLNVLHGVISLAFSGFILIFTLRKVHWFSLVLLYFLFDPLLAYFLSGSDAVINLSDLPRRIIPFLVAFTIIQARSSITWEDMLSWHRNFVLFSIVPQLYFLNSVITGDVFIVNYHYGYLRYIGCFIGPHQAAFYFLLNAVSATFIILYGKQNRLMKIAFFISLAMSLVFLYLTGTRTAVVGIMGYFLYLLIRYKGKNRRIKKLSILFLASFMMKYAIVLFTDIVRYFSGQTGLILVGGGRLVIWAYSVREWLRGRWYELLIGLGYGTDQVYQSGSGLLRAHNDFLTIAFEGGIIGLVLYIGVLIWFMKYFSKSIAVRGETWLHWIVGLGWVAIVTNFISNSFYLRVFPGTYLWMWMAITYMYLRTRRVHVSEEGID